MSSEITVARVQQYSDEVFHLSQQKGSRLRPVVRNEQQRGKAAFYDRIGKRVATKITSRHADTVITDTPHSRRRVTLVDFTDADLIDEQDRVRMLWEPSNQYAVASANAIGRAMDDEIIEQALGVAAGGEEGAEVVAHPNSLKLVPLEGTVGANLNVAALRKAKQLMDEAEVDPSIPRYLACSSSQLMHLLEEDETTSSDYNTIKALVQGDIHTFMGFNFIRTERLNTRVGALSFSTVNGTVGSGSGNANGYRRAFAFASDGLLFAQALALKTSIEERADKNYATQVFTRASFGSTRMEEPKVIEILCNEA
jgi:hypothetical protein